MITASEKHISSDKHSRLPELSYLNVIFAFIVMFIHVSSETITNLKADSWQGLAVTLPWRAASFIVPGFLFLSGLKLFLHMPEQMNYKQYFIRRFRSIYKPYLFCVLIFYYCYFAATPLYNYQISLKQYLHYAAVGDLVGHFYYIVILFQFTILLPLWRWLIRKCKASWLLAVSLIITLTCAVILPSIPIVAKNISFKYNDRIFTSYLIYWIMGCLCGQKYEQAKKFFSKHSYWFFWSIWAAFLCDPVLYCLQRAGRLTLPKGLMEYIHIFYCIAAVAFFFTASSKYIKRKSKGVVKKPFLSIINNVDRASYPIYLWHCLLIYIVNLNMSATSIGARYLIRMAVVMIGTPVICIAAQSIRKWADKQVLIS